MKELLQQLAAYNVWAHQQLLNVIKELPEEKLHQELKSSFGSVFNTVIHMWDAESIWWQRMKLQERITAPGESFTGSLSELADALIKQSKQWQEWINAAHDLMLQHQFIYHNTKKEQFKQPVFQMLIHLFNHSTYHRGQLINMLKQLSIDKVPSTDFIVWSRKRS